MGLQLAVSPGRGQAGSLTSLKTIYYDGQEIRATVIILNDVIKKRQTALVNGDEVGC